MRATATASTREQAGIAIVTHDENLAESLCALLPSALNPSVLEGLDDLLALLGNTPQYAVLFDLDIAGKQLHASVEALEGLHASLPDLPILAMTRSRSSTVRERAEKAGVAAYFCAPFDFHEIANGVLQLLEGSSNDDEHTAAPARRVTFCELVGASEAMQRVYDGVERLAESNTTVLIRGESGTGKELVARAIVALGPRANKPFISLNCAAIPETLIEAELFGHEKGAFTGADRARPGHIELASGGTLFLDEIATLDLGLQSKLLRVIEEHTVTRIGGSQVRKIDFRLITATNEDLEEMMRIGRFREDLYYRINVVPLTLPALREREGDVPVLFGHFLNLYCAAEKLPLKRVEPEVIEILEEYHWPGNVREFENLVQRLVLMVTGPVIEARHLPQHILYTSAARQEALLIPEKGIDFEQEMMRIEAAYVRAALRRTDGNRKAAGDLLKLTPRQMKYLCKKHAL